MRPVSQNHSQRCYRLVSVLRVFCNIFKKYSTFNAKKNLKNIPPAITNCGHNFSLMLHNQNSNGSIIAPTTSTASKKYPCPCLVYHKNSLVLIIFYAAHSSPLMPQKCFEMLRLCCCNGRPLSSFTKFFTIYQPNTSHTATFI